MKRSGEHALLTSEVLVNGLSNIEIFPSDAATCNPRVVGPYRSRSCFHCEIPTKGICKAFALVAQRATPVVTIERPIEVATSDSVGVENRAGTLMAVTMDTNELCAWPPMRIYPP